jgi:hypothetical protein
MAAATKNAHADVHDAIRCFLRTASMVKAFHWTTLSYAAHEATDELYAALDKSFDAFIECAIGCASGVSGAMTMTGRGDKDDGGGDPSHMTTPNALAASLSKFKTGTLYDSSRAVARLCDRHPQLASIRDDIALAVDRCIYKLRMVDDGGKRSR